MTWHVIRSRDTAPITSLARQLILRSSDSSMSLLGIQVWRQLRSFGMADFPSLNTAGCLCIIITSHLTPNVKMSYTFRDCSQIPFNCDFGTVANIIPKGNFKYKLLKDEK